MKYAAHDYQQFATARILEQDAVGLFMDMGLGKTICSLTAIDALLHDTFDADRILIVAPLRVAESTWPDEVEKWDHLSGLKIIPILGSEKQRIRALATPGRIYTINRENVVWLVQHLGAGWNFDTVFIDELSSFKSSKAQRFRALKKIRPLIRRIVGLTGTPAPNSYLDLWPQIYLLDQGARLGKTLTGYRERYFEPDKRNGHIVFSWRLKPGAREAIETAIGDLCISLTAADYLKMPDRIDNTVKVKLPAAAKSAYDRFERDLLLEIDPTEILAANAAVLTGKLLQLANGAVYDEAGIPRWVHDEKLVALGEILEANEGKPVLVFYAYKHDLARIRQKYGGQTLDRPEDVAAWNAGKLPLLLCHPASAGHGLNLQAGGNIIVWFGLPWSLELYQQANARLYRQGQTQAVVIHHLVAAGTMDEQVLQVLQKKGSGQAGLIEALKARIEEVNK
jgi:SNF2 family DNA or RNA helicase